MLHQHSSWPSLASWSASRKGICLHKHIDTARFCSHIAKLSALRRRCYEIQCRDADFTDAYGQMIYRQSACYSTSGSIVVKIIDT